MHTIATKPQTIIVFIPGSWHVPECYDKVIDLLHSKNEISCQKVSLPSNSDNPEATFKDDLDAATSVVMSHLDSGKNVIVVAHSYGGMVGNSVIRGLSGHTESRHNAIIGLILIASGFAITNWSFMDPFFGRPPPAWRRNASTGFAEIVANPAQLFYHDLDPSEASVWVKRLTKQSSKALFEGGQYVYAGWQDVPVRYIGTSEDHGLPVAVQRLQVGFARGYGAHVQHTELKSSHSPFLSLPDKTANIIMKAVSAFESELISGSSLEKEHNLVALWPSKWYKAGVLNGIGEMLGRVVWTLNRGWAILRWTWTRGSSTS